MSRIGVAGRRGEDVRSDVYVAVELKGDGGIKLDIKSRVDSLYGSSIRELVATGLKFFGVSSALVEVEDSGAVPFVMMARIETAIRRALGVNYQEVPEWLPEPGPSFALPSSPDRWRRSRLYLPGNEPKFMINVRIHKPDGVIFDLEDSVPPEEKDAALILVRNALMVLDFGSCERMVRVNPLPQGRYEIEPLIRAGVNAFLIPKCEDEDEIEELDKVLGKIETLAPRRNKIFLMPIIETAAGVFRAHKIARASERIVALTYGLEDYIADIGAQKTAEGWETIWLRSVIVNAARAAGIQPIDTVYADIEDLDGLRLSCQQARKMGFEGKGCIHPRQVRVVNEVFTPDGAEVEYAKQVIRADIEARRQGKSVAVIGSKMIDPPVVRRAKRTIELAIALGRLNPEWDKEVK